MRYLKATEGTGSWKDHVSRLRWLDQHYGKLMLDEISRDAIERVGEIKRRETTPTNSNRYLQLIRAILRRASLDWEWLDKVPKVRLYHEPKRRIRWLTRDEADRLLVELPDHLEAMARFSLQTGLRASNVTGLQWSQIDMSRCCAWVHADQMKASRAVAVPLNAEALGVIREQIGKTFNLSLPIKALQSVPLIQERLGLHYVGLELQIFVGMISGIHGQAGMFRQELHFMYFKS